ncbi:RICIN domain-containing protein [Desulfococcus sp.]|uniref:RICIN domain-containing protein n=1 Tax=Desulfococcus sp. TaxID=2025834 RepID=UPI00359315B2
MRLRRPGETLILAGMLLLAGIGMAWGQPPADRTCLIVSAESGLALQVDGAEAVDLANIGAAGVNGGVGQCWRFRPERFRKSFAIVSLKSGRVADVAGYSRKNGANVQLFRDFGSRNQRWRLVPAGEDRFRILAVHSGKCLTVQSGGKPDRANVHQFVCGSGSGQTWRIQPYPHSDTAYRIVSRKSGKALDVDGKSKEDGANIQQFRLNRGPNQLWTLFPDGESDGSPVYSIISYHSGKAVDVQSSGTGDGANIQQHDYNGGANQRWKFVSEAGGDLRIISVNSGRCMDVKGESVEDGANVQQAGCNGGGNQVWRLIPEGIPPETPPEGR